MLNSSCVSLKYLWLLVNVQNYWLVRFHLGSLDVTDQCVLHVSSLFSFLLHVWLRHNDRSHREPYNTGHSPLHASVPPTLGANTQVPVSQCLRVLQLPPIMRAPAPALQADNTAPLLSPGACAVLKIVRKKFTIGSDLAVVAWCHAHWNRGFPSSNLNRPLTRSLHLMKVALHCVGCVESEKDF